MLADPLEPLLREAHAALARGRPLEAEALADKAVQSDARNAAAWHLLGLARRNLAKHDDAIQALAKATTLDQSVARYHHELGNAFIDGGKLDRAIVSLRRALDIDDAVAEFHNDLGAAYYQKQWHAESEARFRRAIELKPDHGIAYANLGAALRAQGRLQEGRRAYQRALLLKMRAMLPAPLRWRVRTAAPTPAAAEEVLRQAHEAYESGDLRGALSWVREALAKDPRNAAACVALTKLLLASGDSAGALDAAQRAAGLEPRSAAAQAVLCAALRESNLQLSEQAARRAVALDPQSPLGPDCLAMTLWRLGRLQEAEESARRAVQLAPAEPGYRMNLALVLKNAGKLDEARALYRELSNAGLKRYELCLNMGTLALECDGDLVAARAWYRKADPSGGDARATLSSAIADLLDNRFDSAWPKYEARKRVPEHASRHAPYSDLPVWSGESLGERPLLVYREQGLGDEIMFSSMLADLGRRAARISATCDARLHALLARSFPDIQFLAQAENGIPPAAAGADCVIAAGSLGQHLRQTSGDFPVHRGYLRTDPAKVARWRGRLDALGPGRKIGISWLGGLLTTGRASRSMPLDTLQTLLGTPGTCWISVQYGDSAGEAGSFAARTGIALHAFPGVTDDMDELASVIQALDLVVSVCNTTVHVAGAIGKEVLVMAPFLPEWRYGMRGERMLWYPSAHVIRQPSFGDWDSVIREVKARLQA